MATISDLPPPWHASIRYKLVAADSGLIGGPVTSHICSVYDVTTSYELGRTTSDETYGPCHTGGLYCYRSLEAALLHQDAFPSTSARADWPRAIAKVAAWNTNFRDEPIKYGSGKLAYQHMHLLELLPLPPRALPPPSRAQEDLARTLGRRDPAQLDLRVVHRARDRYRRYMTIAARNLELEAELAVAEDTLMLGRAIRQGAQRSSAGARVFVFGG